MGEGGGGWPHCSGRQGTPLASDLPEDSTVALPDLHCTAQQLRKMSLKLSFLLP